MSVTPKSTSHTPLYLRIMEDVAAKIARGEFKLGEALPTREELAVQYQTARTTVNRALQELMREGLITAGSGRRTLVADQTVRTATSIAVVWNWSEEQTQFASAYLDPLLSGMRHACSDFMLQVQFRGCPAEAYRDVLQQTGAQGLLVVRPDYGDCLCLERLRQDGVPVVAVPGILDDDLVPAVSPDNFGGMAQAIDHLVSLGHRDIGFITLMATTPDHFERVQAFHREMARYQLAINPNRVYLAHERHATRYPDHIADWLASTDLPTALVAGDFLMALAVLRRLNELGAKVPSDVSVMSFDDPVTAAHLTPALTVIRQDITALGYRAVERLVQLILGQVVPLADRISTELLVRGTTAQPRTSV